MLHQKCKEHGADRSASDALGNFRRRSKTKFWQMVGRGTRLCPDLFGPGLDKQDFYIFDYCQNLEFFGSNPEGYDAPLQESVKAKVFKGRLSLAVQLQTYSAQSPTEGEAISGLRGELLDQMHEHR